MINLIFALVKVGLVYISYKLSNRIWFLLSSKLYFLCFSRNNYFCGRSVNMSILLFYKIVFLWFPKSWNYYSHDNWKTKNCRNKIAENLKCKFFLMNLVFLYVYVYVLFVDNLVLMANNALEMYGWFQIFNWKKLIFNLTVFLLAQIGQYTQIKNWQSSSGLNFWLTAKLIMNIFEIAKRNSE